MVFKITWFYIICKLQEKSVCNHLLKALIYWEVFKLLRVSQICCFANDIIKPLWKMNIISSQNVLGQVVTNAIGLIIKNRNTITVVISQKPIDVCLQYNKTHYHPSFLLLDSCLWACTLHWWINFHMKWTYTHNSHYNEKRHLIHKTDRQSRSNVYEELVSVQVIG